MLNDSFPQTSSGRWQGEMPEVRGDYRRWQRRACNRSARSSKKACWSGTKNRSLAVHEEHTIVVTGGAPLVLTAA